MATDTTNILIIGNGFDLAHELPTSYKDFLYFLDVFQQKYKKLNIDNNRYSYSNISHNDNLDKLNNNLQEFIKKMKQDNLLDELYKLSSCNIWFDHFFEHMCKSKSKGVNWIDFECEITNIIKSLEYLKNFNETNLKLELNNRKSPSNDPTCSFANNFIKNLYSAFRLYKKGQLESEALKTDSKKTRFTEDSFCNNEAKKIIKILIDELNNLIRCLEIYLDYIIDMPVYTKLSDINKIGKIDKVLSFNYTTTFEKIYDVNHQIEYDYIHGKANVHNSIKSNNMVLGIDEYLTDDEKNKKLDFIQFKKYFQRIFKKTGCLYKTWIEDINSKSFEIFIYGHSLDVTDKDILKELILLPNSQVTIFYLNKYDYTQKISNMVRLIGQDELISRVYGNNPSIIFKKITK